MKLTTYLPLLIFCILYLVFGVTSVSAADKLYFVHQDHLNSTSIVTDANGGVVNKETYFPYGSTRTESGNQSTERGYTGQVSDVEQTGLYYYNARYYNPTIAIFTQADTVNDGFNRYTYVGNNPISHTDPSGHQTETCTTFDCWLSVTQSGGWFTPGRTMDDTTEALTSMEGQLIFSTGIYAGVFFTLGPGAAEFVDILLCGLNPDPLCITAATIPGPNINRAEDVYRNADELEGGFFSKIFADDNNLYKIFKNPDWPNNKLQQSLYKQFSGQHPWITYLGDIGDKGFVQKRIQGSTLRKFLKSGGRLSMDEVISSVDDLANFHATMGYAHGDLAWWDSAQSIYVMNTDNIIVATNPNGKRSLIPIDFFGYNQFWNDLDSPVTMAQEIESYQKWLDRNVTVK